MGCVQDDIMASDLSFIEMGCNLSFRFMSGSVSFDQIGAVCGIVSQTEANYPPRQLELPQ